MFCKGSVLGIAVLLALAATSAVAQDPVAATAAQKSAAAAATDGLVESAKAAASLTLKERLGRAIFFDTNLSRPRGQSCASCHDPKTGFSNPDSTINATIAVHPGAIDDRFGNRKPPTASYAGFSPVFHFDQTEGLWIGGMFFDGRATGETLGDPLAEQAQAPFLNPVEQNMPSAVEVCKEVAKAKYAGLFKQVWGKGSLNYQQDPDLMYRRIAESIAAFERSKEVSPFTSKYDYFLKGKAQLTTEEAAGLALFNGKGQCNLCHPSEPGPNGEPPLFTDFSYDNLGIPRNPLNPFYAMPPEFNPAGFAFVDPGLGGFLQSAAHPDTVYLPEWGKHKVSTLRNVDKRPNGRFIKAYGHNGYFTSLKEIVHFYNTRDALPLMWPEPEVPQNVNIDELGNLGLTDEEEDAIVAFMGTLSDGYRPPKKKK